MASLHSYFFSFWY